jgi:hypothetical protein
MVMMIMMMLMIIIMSMGSEYVSELLPPTGLLFISQVIYEHGERWWMISTGVNSRFFHRALSGNRNSTAI